MPCYAIGRVRITNIDVLSSLAAEMGLEVRDKLQSIEIYNANEEYVATINKSNISQSRSDIQDLLRNIIQNYSVRIIVREARLKNWKIKSSVKTNDGKLKVRLTQ